MFVTLVLADAGFGMKTGDIDQNLPNLKPGRFLEVRILDYFQAHPAQNEQIATCEVY